MLHYCLILGFISSVVAQSDTCPRIIDKEKLRDHLTNLFNQPRSETDVSQRVLLMQALAAEASALTPVSIAPMISSNVQSIPGSTGQNFFFIIKGARYNTTYDRPILVGANLDTVALSPGVNDNGSGMAASIEIIRAVVNALANQTCTFLNTVVGVAFDNKNMDLEGSATWVDAQLTTYLGPLGITDFQGAFILDVMMNFNSTPNSQDVPAVALALFPTEGMMIADNDNRGDFMMTYARQDDVPLAALLKQEWYGMVGGDFATTDKYRFVDINLPFTGTAQTLTPTQVAEYGTFIRGDHISFWNVSSSVAPNGLKAIHVTDTADLRGVMRQCFQQPCDDTSIITEENLDFLNIAADAVLRAVVILATENNDSQCIGACQTPLPAPTCANRNCSNGRVCVLVKPNGCEEADDGDCRKEPKCRRVRTCDDLSCGMNEKCKLFPAEHPDAPPVPECFIKSCRLLNCNSKREVCQKIRPDGNTSGPRKPTCVDLCKERQCPSNKRCVIRRGKAVCRRRN